jgi:tRNA A-37 threonylcarbamoyl transferase component Bud32
MIIMSYGGVSARKNPIVTDFILERLVKAFTEIHALGVYHDDLALRNILIDKDRVAIIDFENSSITDPEDVDVVEEQEWAMEGCQRVKESKDMRDFRNKERSEWND